MIATQSDNQREYGRLRVWGACVRDRLAEHRNASSTSVVLAGVLCRFLDMRAGQIHANNLRNDIDGSIDGIVKALLKMGVAPPRGE